ncbi:MAG: discoidin domain-containing protein, partial [Myxococcales bacterium]
NGASARTRDEAPSAVTDLTVISGTGRALGQATLAIQWTAPGDDATVGTASSYDIRSSTGTISASTFAAAQPSLPGVTPAAAGTRQQYTISGLNPGVRYTVALKATDDRGNVSPLSNVVTFSTPDELAPGAVTDLAATTGTTAGTVNVSLTAPGDDGAQGTAQAYDLRWSLTPLDAASFGAAAVLATPAPAAAGTRQTFVVGGLPPEATVHLMLRARDDAGNTSVVSNDATVATPQVPPAPIADLAITGGTGTDLGKSTLNIQWTAPGDDGTVGTAAGYDIRTSTALLTAANFDTGTVSQPSLPPAAAGTRQQYTVTGLNPATRYYVAIKTIDRRGNISALSNVASSSTPDEMPPAAPGALSATTGTTAGTLLVSLTAPGDDGMQGTAKSYELRWSMNSLDAASFGAATVLTAPAPAVAGTRQTFTVNGLPNETLIHLMVRARDDAGYVSAVSNEASATTMDVAPGAISDVHQVARGTGTITLGWTAPGDDGSVGTAVEYDLRYATAPLTDATFATAARFPIAPPHGAGFPESAAVSGLTANKTYSFAIKTKDDRNNWSALSNVFSAPTEDTLAPGAIADLSAAPGNTAGTVVLRWTASGDDGSDGTATRYDLRRSTAAITDATWDAATVITVAAPRAAGTAETVTLTGLKGETTFHFAIRAVDEAGNTASLSNDAAAATAPVAPGAVANLAARLSVTGGVASAALTWTAPGDDGVEGQAVAYDVRYATAPITAASFAAATPLSTPPAPQPAGGAETASVSGLHESTTYYFALKTVDDTQTWSALSNVASLVVPDLTKPAAPSSLIVALPSTQGKRLVPTKITPSSLLGPAWDGSNVVDGDPTSSWATASSDTEHPENLVLDLGASASLDQIKLTADAKYLDLFPRDFTIAVSADASTWKTVVTEEGFSATSADSLAWGFPAEPARYVRLGITATGTSFGKHYAIVADFDVYSASATDGRAQLTWLAPGDDGYAGKATQYQLYRSTHTFSEADLSAVTAVPGVPSPLDAGLLQTMLVTGLRGETTYYWALRAIDEAGNVGPLSAVVAAKTNDVPPAAVRNLSGKSLGYTEVQLTWTATGDDDTIGTAASAELRYLPGALSSRNFATAALVPDLPLPAASGVSQTVTVTNLAPGVSYHFALVARDAAGNASHLSNVAVVTTQRLPDIMPPAAIVDLTVALPAAGGQRVASREVKSSSEQLPSFAAAAVSDGDHTTFWASTPRAASQEEWVRVEYAPGTIADRVRLWPSDSFLDLFPPDVTVRVSPDGLAWTTVASATGIIAAAGQPTTIPFTATSLRYVELRATRLARHASGSFYAAIAELETLTASEPPGTAVISWTAPADDGPSGRAASTDLHIGPCPIDMTTAPVVATTTPGAPGTPERARAAGLTSGRTYCAAIQSTDAAGNVSALSNVATIVLP